MALQMVSVTDCSLSMAGFCRLGFKSPNSTNPEGHVCWLDMGIQLGIIQIAWNLWVAWFCVLGFAETVQLHNSKVSTLVLADLGASSQTGNLEAISLINPHSTIDENRNSLHSEITRDSIFC
jgi:hypothetical protein